MLVGLAGDDLTAGALALKSSIGIKSAPAASKLGVGSTGFMRVANIAKLPVPLRDAVLNIPGAAVSDGQVIFPSPPEAFASSLSLASKLAIGAGVAAALLLGYRMLGKRSSAPVVSNPHRRRRRR